MRDAAAWGVWRRWLAAALALAGLALAPAPALAGVMVRATCPCGYDSGNLFIFGGRANFKTYCAFPVLCQGCAKLALADLYAGPPACSACPDPVALAYDDPRLSGRRGEKVIASWNTAARLGRALQLTDGTYLCPACRDFSLTFAMVGYWD